MSILGLKIVRFQIGTLKEPLRVLIMLQTMGQHGLVDSTVMVQRAIQKELWVQLGRITHPMEEILPMEFYYKTMGLML